MKLKREIETKSGLFDTLVGLSALAQQAGASSRAAQIIAAAETRRADLSIVHEPLTRKLYTETVALLKAALGEEAFSATFEVGQTLTLETATRLALAET